MKPDLNYERDILANQIQDYISCLESELDLRKLNDPLFEQFSIEKFAMEQLLEELSKHNDISPIKIAENFRERLFQSVRNDCDPEGVFLTSCDAIQLILESLYVD